MIPYDISRRDFLSLSAAARMGMAGSALTSPAPAGPYRLRKVCVFSLHFEYDMPGEDLGLTQRRQMTVIQMKRDLQVLKSYLA